MPTTRSVRKRGVLEARAASPADAVTGAGSFTGRYIAAELVRAGRRVVSLSRRVDGPNPFGDSVTFARLDFAHPDLLRESLAGVDTLYNTYWIRFERGPATFEQTIANTGVLLRAAREAGVRRVVHVSVVNADRAPAVPYFAAKARTEQLVREVGLSHAIVRPTLTYGDDDILINNLAWTLRHFPIFGMPGSGRCRIQPVHVEDVGRLAVRLGAEESTVTADAAGPETYTLREMVRLIRQRIGSRSAILPLPPVLALWASRVVGLLVRDVVLTRDEIDELVGSLLVSHGPPTGSIRLSAWLAERGPHIGQRWHSELARNYRDQPQS